MRAMAQRLLALALMPSTIDQLEAFKPLAAALDEAAAAVDAGAWQVIAQLLVQLLLAPVGRPLHPKLLAWCAGLPHPRQTPLRAQLALQLLQQLAPPAEVAAGRAGAEATARWTACLPPDGLVQAAASLLGHPHHPELAAWLAPVAAPLLLSLGSGTQAALTAAEAMGGMSPQVCV